MYENEYWKERGPANQTPQGLEVFILAVVAFHSGDVDQASRQAAWINDLGGCFGHSLLLIADTGVDKQLVLQARASYARSFDEVTLVPFTNIYGNRIWTAGDASVPNANFSLAGRHPLTEKEPWLWLEPDAVPLREGWLDKLQIEYTERGKRFLGDYVDGGNSGLPVTPHMSGVAVYPASVIEWAGTLLTAIEIAFDVQGAQQILPQMAVSNRILHRWKGDPFSTKEQIHDRIFAIKPDCVLYHADKSGSLIQLLRGGSDPHSHAAPATPQTRHDSSESEARHFTGEIGRYEGAGPDIEIPRSGAIPIHHGPSSVIIGPITPWENLGESKVELQALITRLKEFCTNSRHTRYVREALHDAHVIDHLGYKRRRQK